MQYVHPRDAHGQAGIEDQSQPWCAMYRSYGRGRLLLHEEAFGKWKRLPRATMDACDTSPTALLISGGVGTVLWDKLEVNNENDGGEYQEPDADPQERHHDLPSVHARDGVFDAGIQPICFDHLEQRTHTYAHPPPPPTHTHRKTQPQIRAS